MQITLEICVLISIRYMIRANGALFEYENYCNLEFAIKNIMNENGNKSLSYLHN